jgi:hypothetical protein
MNVVIFWDIALCSQYVNQRFGGIYLQLQGRKSAEQVILDSKDGGDMFLRNVDSHCPISYKMATII